MKQAKDLLERAEEFTEADISFLESMSDWDGEPTPRQQAWLDRLEACVARRFTGIYLTEDGFVWVRARPGSEPPLPAAELAARILEDPPPLRSNDRTFLRSLVDREVETPSEKQAKWLLNIVERMPRPPRW